MHVTCDGTSFVPSLKDISSFQQFYGKANELTLSVFNVDNIVTALVEDPYLVGNCSTNSVVAFQKGDGYMVLIPEL